MALFPTDKKVFLIADHLFAPALLKLKEKDPTLDLKVLDREEVISLLSFHYVKDPLPYLLSLGKYDYSRAKKLAKILPVYEEGKDEELDSYRKDLEEKGYLAFDPLGKRKLENKAIYLFERDEDYELRSLFERNHISYSLLHKEDLPLESHPLSFPVYLFKDKFLQYFYLFADLRKRIVFGKEKAEDFAFVGDPDDVYYLSFFSSLFHLPFSLSVKTPLLTDKAVKEAIKESYEKQSFTPLLSLTPEEDSPLALVQTQIKTYGLEKLSFASAYSSLIEILASFSLNNSLNETGIPFSSSLRLDNKKTILTNFVYGTFYKVYADDNIFADKKLKEIHVNTSYYLTALDKRKKETYLSLANIVSASRVKIHLQDKIYPSPFVEEFSLPEVEKEIEEEGCYTDEAKNLLLSYLKDRDHAKKGDGYRTFDPSFTPIKTKKEHQVSVTDFSIYADCPFKFYLDRILHIENYDPNQDCYPMALGNLTHRVMENIYSDTYDFEEAFKSGTEDFYKTYQNNNAEVPPSSEVYLAIVKVHLKDFAFTIRSQRDKNHLIGERREVPITLSLNSSDGKRGKIKGRIDKILYSQGHHDTYYTIVDYKSGKEFFNPEEVFLGKSLQLPLYVLALKEKENEEYTNNATFGGFGIQHIYAKTYPMDNKVYDEKGYRNTIKISGILRADTDYLDGFDTSSLKKNDEGKIVDIQKVNGADYVTLRYFYYPNSLEASSIAGNIDYTYEEMMDDAKTSAGKILSGIEKAEYPIHPLSVTKTIKSDKLPCRFCAFRNICYRRKEDINNRYPDVVEKFSSDEEDEENGDTL